jgi:hypothetical protein
MTREPRPRSVQDFDDILAEVRRADEPDVGRFVNPAAIATFPLGEPVASAVSPEWMDEADWLDEMDETAIVPTEFRTDDVDEAIAQELGLSVALTEDDLHRVRRRFMWRHHPDRNLDIPRNDADRRVAIANMLIDQALERLNAKKAETRERERRRS